jgi:hypothetical protein
MQDMQCEALPISAGNSLVALYSVQYSRLAQLVKSCGEWVSACDEDYFEKQELNSIIKEFESFYQKSFTGKRSANVVLDAAQFHRQRVANLAKRFPVFQVWQLFSVFQLIP